MKTRNRVFLEVIVIACLMLATEVVADEGNLGAVLDQYKTSSLAFYGKLQGFAVSLLFKLWLVELAWSGIKWVLERKPFEELLSHLVSSSFPPLFFFLIIQKGADWLPTIIHSFEYFGASASGLDASILDPGAIFEQGLRLQNNMIVAFNSATGSDAGGITGALNALESTLPALLMFAICIIILIGFAIMAFNVFIIWAEAYLLLAVAPVLMAFAGMRWTRDMAPKTFNSMIAVGIKILIIMLLMSIMVNLAPIWAAEAATWRIDYWSPLWRVAFSALGCGFLAWKAPQIAANAISGTSSLTAGDALQMAAMAGAAAVGAAAFGANTFLDTAKKGTGVLNNAAPGMGQAFGEAMNMRGGDTIGEMGGGPESFKGEIPEPATQSLQSSTTTESPGNASDASLAPAEESEDMKKILAQLVQNTSPTPRTTSQKIQDGLRGMRDHIPNDQATVGGDGVKLKD